jgi:hypothetical protein
MVLILFFTIKQYFEGIDYRGFHLILFVNDLF